MSYTWGQSWPEWPTLEARLAKALKEGAAWKNKCQGLEQSRDAARHRSAKLGNELGQIKRALRVLKGAVV